MSERMHSGPRQVSIASELSYAEPIAIAPTAIKQMTAPSVAGDWLPGSESNELEGHFHREDSGEKVVQLAQHVVEAVLGAVMHTRQRYRVRHNDQHDKHGELGRRHDLQGDVAKRGPP